MHVSTISPRELAAKLESGEPIELIDVRNPVEFREVHCACARNLPLADLDPAAVMNSRHGAADKPLYVICRSGARAKRACEKFLAAGFTNIVNVEGGTLAWAACGLPVNRSGSGLSLERQVQIGTGLLILFGAAAGYFFHPCFLGLSALCGAGLLLTGVTGACSMGLLLARMPWNRASKTNPVCPNAPKIAINKSPIPVDGDVVNYAI